MSQAIYRVTHNKRQEVNDTATSGRPHRRVGLNHVFTDMIVLRFIWKHSKQTKEMDQGM